MNKVNKQAETHRCRQQHGDYQKEEGWGGSKGQRGPNI